MLHEIYATILFIALMWSGEPRPVYPAATRPAAR